MGWAGAQTKTAGPQPQIRGVIDDTQRTPLVGSRPPQAQASFDRGAAAADLPAERMILVLRRPAQQEAALEEWLKEVQNSGSPEYHRYLTPEEFGERYGVSESDLSAITGWLQAKGFSVERVLSGRTGIVFSGTAGQVQTAFHTPIHRYVVNGEEHYANAGDADVPTAMSGVVSGLIANNFGPRAMSRSRGKAVMDRATHRVSPLLNVPVQQTDCLSGYCFGVTPGDFAAIYDTKPLLAAGIDGSGVTIGIIGISDIDTSTVERFRENFLPQYSAANLPTLIIDGPDPGTENSDGEIEAYLDVEESGGVAPNATIDLYAAANSFVANGVGLAIARALDDNQAWILSLSFGECEANLGNTYNQFYNGLFEQAAAQGMTVLVSSGDSGSAACDPPPNSYGFTQATQGLAVNGLASTPYTVALGGTDFYYPSSATLSTLDKYWNAPSGSDPDNNADWSSAKGYIPEKPWNQSDPVLDQVNLGASLGAAGGGPSSCVVSTGTSPVVCESGYPKPDWQSGFGDAAVRDVPDVSLFASVGGNYSFTVICTSSQLEESADCPVPNAGPNSASGLVQFTAIGGTSVSAPAMAGVMALIDQKTQSRQGQADAVLYPLYKQVPSAFHDIAVGTNAVSCAQGSPSCGTNGFMTGYSAAAGYDDATGLGSIDAAVLVNHWADVTLKPTQTTLAINPTSAKHGTALTFTVNVSGGPTSGDIALISTAPTNGQYATTCAAFPCTFTYAGLPGGTYTVSARYAGDGTYASSTSDAKAVTISQEPSQVGVYYEIGETNYSGAGQVTQLNGQTNLVYGGIVTFTAVPAPADVALPSDPTLLKSTPATGTIVVSDNGTQIGAPLALDASGKATFEDYNLSVGQHSLTAAYSGDASYGVSTTVTPVATPMVFTIVAAPVTLQVGPLAQIVPTGSSGTATGSLVVDGSAAPTGTITFSVLSASGTTTVLPAVPVIAGSGGFFGATMTVPASVLTAGQNTVTATYSGDSNYQAAKSIGGCYLEYETIPTQVDISLQPQAPAAGQPTMFKFMVVRDVILSVPGFPTGTVGVVLDGSQVGSFPLTSDGSGDGIASYTTSALTAGSHTLSVNYSGDTGDQPSNAARSFVVVPPSLDFTLAATPVSFGAGLRDPSATSTLTLTANYPQSATNNINLSCAVPAGVSHIACSVPSVVTLAAGSTNVTAMVTISVNGTTAQTAMTNPPQQRERGRMFLALLLPVVLAGRRRGWRAVVCSLMLVAVAAGVSGCGGSTATVSGSYDVMVTASAGSVSHQIAVAVTVQ